MGLFWFLITLIQVVTNRRAGQLLQLSETITAKDFFKTVANKVRTLFAPQADFAFACAA